MKTIQMEMRGNVLSCDDHTIQLGHITRVWMGNVPIPGLRLWQQLAVVGLIFFSCCYGRYLALDAVVLMLIAGVLLVPDMKRRMSKGVHIECGSGTIYSFITTNYQLMAEAYEMLANSIARVDEVLELQEESSGDQVEVEVKMTEKNYIHAYPELENELLQLKEYFEQNEPNQNEMIESIQQAIDKNRMTDKEGMKQIFGVFITNGVISVCNELGLFKLIEAIKTVFV